ncbi:hypothetical protein [Geobacillus uzenensis]|uniref:hypothetical protein n=1 Tax=Geobacillus uzenensis TaxID=129339 RepID=UPI000B5C8A20|nr:hypothetical protein [Geobacillus uzenensis]
MAEESQALELDNTKSEGRERPTINKSHPGDLEAKCSSPAGMLASQGRRLFGRRELGAEARQ